MRFEDLDTDFVRRLGTPADANRAQELVDNNQVRYRYRLANSLQAMVRDQQVLVPVTVTLENDDLKAECGCPDKNEWCPYSLAVLLAYLKDPEGFLNRAALKERLKQYSRHELIKMILDLADEVQEVREFLRQENLDLEEILENIDQVITAFGTAAPSTLPALEDKLRHAQTLADRLAQSGRLSEARAIYFYLLDNIFGLEEEKGRTDLIAQDLKRELFEEYGQFIHEDRNLDMSLVQQEIEQLESRPSAVAGEFDFAELKKDLANP